MFLAYDDLASFIAVLERAGKLKKISTEATPFLNYRDHRPRQ